MNGKVIANTLAGALLILGVPLAYANGYVPFNHAVMTQMVIITSGVFLYGEELKDGENDE